MKANSWIVLSLAALIMACDESPSGIDFGPGRQTWGRELARHGNPFQATWSADSREIYYLTSFGEAGIYELNAVDVQADRTRRLAEVLGRNTGRNDIQASDDGRFVYFTVTDPNVFLKELLYRAPGSGGSAVEVTRHLEWSRFTVSSDGSRVAFLSADSITGEEWLAVADDADSPSPTTRPLARTDGVAQPFEFSPDETLLVFSSRDRTVRLAYSDGGLQTVLPSPRTTSPEEISGVDVHWSANTPHILVAKSSTDSRQIELFDLDALSGVRTRVGALLEGESGPWALTWSDDGVEIAAWVPIETGPDACSGEGACTNRRLVHWRLYLTSSHSQESPQILAEVVAAEGVRWLSFSPDGRWIAYMLFQRLYVHALD